MNLCPARGSLNPDLLRKLFVGHGTIYHRSRHTFCALSSDDYKGSRPQGIIQKTLEYELCSPLHPVRRRLPWDKRLNTPTFERRSTETRIPFSSHKNAPRCYIPYVQELLNGLWSLDQDPIWILIDDLVATGEPQSSPGAFPEFQQWKHIVMMSPHFSDVILTLVAQGYLRYRSPLKDKDEESEEQEEEDVEGVHNQSDSTVPTWVVAYILTTMTNTRIEAYEGLAFCLSQLDATPKHLQAPLLLLSMCSLSTHNVAVQVPILLASFLDVFSSNVSNLEETDHGSSFGTRESIMYQYNVLLTLLSQFPHVPGFARRTIQFLQRMEASGVPLDIDTATKLTISRFASNLLVTTVRDILEKQGVHERQSDSDDLSFALMRFYSKRSNQAEASKYIEPSLRTRPGTYAKSYIRSFRDAAEAFTYLKTIETKKHQDTKDTGDINHSISDQRLAISMSPTSSQVTKRYIYTSFLHSVAISKTLSAETFRDIFMTIREAHGDDRELETVALSGMLKRNAWEQAKNLWDQWQTTNRSIRSILHEMRRFLDKRERSFGDARKVRRTLGWSKLTEEMTFRRMNMLSVDANALSVVVRALAGPKPGSLANAFATMDEYAVKMQKSGPTAATLKSPHVTSPSSIEPVVEQIQLTSRVINCFMVRAMYFRRPDIVFKLWDGMTSYYGVDCSTTTLDILIRSARLAASMETALIKVTPRWMKISADFFSGKPVFPNLSAEILWMLSPSYSPTPRWDGVPAWRMVRHLFREEIIFANWPWLRHVDIPARAIRGDDATGQVEALKELSLHGGLWGTQVRKMGNYPHLMLSARIFREYIIMLGRVHRSSEIPEVLAWMRALDIFPSRRALSHSLALWSQVGLESLPDDAWGSARSKHIKNIFPSLAHPRHGGEYDRLLAWLEDWVGQENMPEESEVLESFRYIQELEEREVFLY